MKSLNKIAITLGIATLVASCHDTKAPNYQYMPNMYEAVSYETYSESKAFANGKEGQLPPDHTIKRGFVPYELPNTTAGYEASKANVSPLTPTEADMEKAKELFNIYCAICHGEKGNGQGNLAKREKLLGIPDYKARQITVGSVFHVETYGLNSMGSYANQLDTHERWLVANYVMKLRAE
ncbi:MAG: cytochrome c [Flavobacterium sp.]|nr:cytochrome c [Flavobacterium sp.]